MSYIPEGGQVSAANSSLVPLAGGATFTGTYEDITAFCAISILGSSDVAGTLYADFSIDGITTDRVVQLSDGSDGSFGLHQLTPVAQFFRVRVVNGVAPQASLRLQTIYTTGARVSLPTSRVSQTLGQFSDVLNTRASLFGTLANGQTVAPVQVNGGLAVDVIRPVTPYGELDMSEHNPRVQIDAIYGVLTTDIETFTSGAGSAITAQDSVFTADCGTAAGGYATIRSKRLIRYRPGQGVTARLNGFFEAGVANYLSGAGIFTATDGFWFGYLGTAFGVTRRVPGALEIRTLTITGGATGAGTISVTLNGTATNVVIGGALSAAATAQTIAATSFSGWYAYAVGTTVTFQARTAVAMAGAFAFAAGATGATATGPTQVEAGAANDFTTGFVPQTSWNIDVCDGSNGSTNPSGIDLDPSKANIYQIEYADGAGTITFSVMKASDGLIYPVHKIAWPNANVTPNALNPSMRVGWISASVGSTTSVKVYGINASAFTHGPAETLRNPFAQSRTATGVAATEVALLSIRNNYAFANIVNQRNLRPLTASIAVEGNKPAQIKVYLNAAISGTPAWAQVDSESCVAYEGTNGLTASSGKLVAALSVGGGGQSTVDLEKLDLRMSPGDTLTITGQITGGAGSNVATSINWAEI